MIRLSLFIKLVIEKRFINEALEKGYGVSAVSKASARLKQEIPNYRKLSKFDKKLDLKIKTSHPMPHYATAISFLIYPASISIDY